MRNQPLSTVLVVTVALTLLASCRAPEPWETEEPKEALEGFVTAIYFGRADLAWHFLAPETQKEIEARAAAINADAGRDVVKPDELISGVGFLGPHHIASYDVVAGDDPTRVAVTVTTQLGAAHTVKMVRIDAVWRVAEIEIPPIADAREPADGPTQAVPPLPRAATPTNNADDDLPASDEGPPDGEAPTPEKP
jgi:hypothetical protein